MMKKKLGLLGVLAVAAMALVAAPAAASATETCIPQDAVAPYDEVVSEAYDEIVVDSAAVDLWYSWTGGPSEEHAFPGPDWQVDQGEHNGFDQAPGLLQRDKGESGESDWFYHEVIAEVSHVVHHDAVIVHHEGIPAVVCPPDEPTTQQPTCTTVTGEVVVNDDGVLEVDGDWDTESISLPFSGTLADIGTVLDIEATPIQYVGLHIRTAQGSITYEEEPSYGGKLWSEASWDGVSAGMGYAAFGTIEEFIAQNGDVVVTGIDLLYTHPEASSTTVTSATIGCTLYLFEEEVVVVPPTEEPVVTPPAPVVETPAPAAVVTPAVVPAAELAETGFDAMWLPWAALLVIAGGISLTILHRSARRR